MVIDGRSETRLIHDERTRILQKRILMGKDEGKVRGRDY